jgi:hypothetical protein
MHPDRVDRQRLERLTDLPRALCDETGVRQDPCVLDVLISITRFMNGEPPRPWWFYTAERKRLYGAVVRQADANSQFGKA